MKKGNAVFAFTLKNKEGQTDSWYIDLKDKGVVAKGDAPAGKKADGQSFQETNYSRYGNRKDKFTLASLQNLKCC